MLTSRSRLVQQVLNAQATTCIHDQAHYSPWSSAYGRISFFHDGRGWPVVIPQTCLSYGCAKTRLCHRCTALQGVLREDSAEQGVVEEGRVKSSDKVISLRPNMSKRWPCGLGPRAAGRIQKLQGPWSRNDAIDLRAPTLLTVALETLETWSTILRVQTAMTNMRVKSLMLWP